MKSFVITMDFWARQALAFAWPMLWQSSLLMAIVFALDLALRRKVRAAVRYTFWMVVLVKLLLPPSLAFPSGLGWWLRHSAPKAAVYQETQMVVGYRAEQTDSLPKATMPATAPSPRPVVSLAAACLVVWPCVSLGLLVWMVVRWGQVALEAQGASAAPAYLQEPLEETRRRVALGRFVRLKIRQGNESPAVCGLFRPTILMPRALLDQLAPAQMRAVLLHELLHLRRGDVWVNCAQGLLQIAYWWHPLLWIANARIRHVREEAVDDAVMLALRSDSDTYAPTLLEVAKLALRRPLLNLGLVGIFESQSSLRQRIERLIDFRPPRKAGLTLASAICVLALAAVALPMGEAPPSSTPPLGVTSSGKISWPDPRFEGYAEIKLEPQFLIANETALRGVLPSLIEQPEPLVLASNEVAELDLRLKQASAQPYTSAEPLAFGKFSGGTFHWLIGVVTNNWVNYLTQSTGEQTIVTGAEVTFLATQPDWIPLELTVVPWSADSGVRCQMRLGPAENPNTAQADVTIPRGGAVVWAALVEANARNYEIVVLREQSGVTNEVASSESKANPSGEEGVTISPHKMEPNYLAQHEDRKLDGQIKLRMIVLNKSTDPKAPPAQKVAEEILKKIDGGASFAEMASIYSQDSFRRQGGDLGWVEKSQLRKELAEAALSLKPGERSGVIETPECCYLLLVEDQRTSHHKPLSEVRGSGIFSTNQVLDSVPLERKTGKAHVVGDLPVIEGKPWWFESLSKGSHVEYDVATGMVRATNGALLRYGQTTLTADQVTGVISNHQLIGVIADGNVRIQQAEHLLASDHVQINFSNGEAAMQNMQAEPVTTGAGLSTPIQSNKSPYENGELGAARAQLTQALRNTTTNSYLDPVRQDIYSELCETRLQTVSFNNLPLRAVLASLTDWARDADFGQNDITFTYQREPDDIGDVPITIEPALTDVRLVDIIDVVAKVSPTPLKYSFTATGIVFARKTSAVALYTRIIKVDPQTFIRNLSAAVGANKGAIIGQAEIRKFFTSQGVDWDPPQSFFFNDREGYLMIRATLADLGKVERAVSDLSREPTQINIKAKFVTLPEELSASMYSSLRLTNIPTGNPSTLSALVTPPQSAVLLKALESADGVVLNSASVTTLSGREAQIQVVDLKTVFTNINGLYQAATIPFGPTLDVIPSILSDGRQIQLVLEITMTEFLGYDDPGTQLSADVDRKRTSAVFPLPRIRVGKIKTTLVVPEGQSLLLGTVMSGEPAPVAPTSEPQKKQLLVLLTPRMINPDGTPRRP